MGKQNRSISCPEVKLICFIQSQAWLCVLVPFHRSEPSEPPRFQELGFAFVLLSVWITTSAFILIAVGPKLNDLSSGEGGWTAVSSIILAVGPVVDGVAPSVFTKGLTRLYAVDESGVRVPFSHPCADYALNPPRQRPMPDRVSCGSVGQKDRVLQIHV